MKLKLALLVAWVMSVQVLWGGVYEDGLEAKKAGRHEEAALLLGQATAAAPQNVEAWYHYGTVLGWLKRHEEARVALGRGLSLAPQDFDLRLGEARVLAWMEDYAGADERLVKLEAEFPDNLDVAVMRSRVAGWRGDRAEARHRYEAILQTDPRQIDALTGLGDLEAEAQKTDEARSLYERALQVEVSPDVQRRLDGLKSQPRQRVDMGMTGSTFTQGERDEWWSIYASYGQKVLGWDAWLRTEVGERFGLQDETWEVGLGGQVLPSLQATLYGGVTPDADFSADWYADASLRWRVFDDLGFLDEGWLLIEGRWADYAVSGLLVSRVGWEQRLARHWTLNARWLHFAYDSGLSADGWLAFVAWEPRDRLQFRLGAGSAVESLTNQTLNTERAIPSWTVFAGVTVPLTERWQVRLDFEREDVQDRLVRYGLAVGLTCFF
ncbi:tetratricopeptide repeat protein [Prosthecobacter sp. SYSU 5D2]|uniref:tetratricopeptide repeat protein n=1 Tax=Prosthecobacter sp. SYSU 5D2 TaxID=3134134 RepID=UPI0031FE9C0D